VGGLATAVFLGQFLSPFAGQPVVNEFGIGGLFFSAGIFIAGIALLFVLFRKAIPEFINTADQPKEKELPISAETIQRKAI
jgi:asparagine N-glycosylation enzyme membrane subunit Stt3